jgi:ribosomal protein S11
MELNVENNTDTSIVVTSSNGLIIFGLTTGILKFKGSKKNTFVATLTVAKKIY